MATIIPLNRDSADDMWTLAISLNARSYICDEEMQMGREHRDQVLETAEMVLRVTRPENVALDSMRGTLFYYRNNNKPMCYP